MSQQSAYVLGDGQRLVLRATPKDRLGREAEVERPAWALEDLSGTPDTPCALLEVSPHDPTVCAVVALKQGAAVVKFTCDADLGEGVALVSRSIHVQIVAFAAVAVEIEGQLVPDEDEPAAPAPPAAVENEAEAAEDEAEAEDEQAAAPPVPPEPPTPPTPPEA